VKLLGEISGILNWALEGYREWIDQGLRPPEAVRTATDSYREESDVLGTFIDEELVRLRPDQAGNTGGEIYKSYQLWCEENGEKALNNRQFGDALRERGFAKRKIGGVVRYFGIGLVVRTVQDNLDNSSGRSLRENTSSQSTGTTVQTIQDCPAQSNLKDLETDENPPENPNITPEDWKCPF
jgi:putative DNA primase/helicase